MKILLLIGILKSWNLDFWVASCIIHIINFKETEKDAFA